MLSERATVIARWGRRDTILKWSGWSDEVAMTSAEKQAALDQAIALEIGTLGFRELDRLASGVSGLMLRQVAKGERRRRCRMERET